MHKHKVHKKILFSDNTLWGLVNFRGYIFTHLVEEGYNVVLVAPQEKDTVMKIEVPEGVVFRPVRINRCGRNPLDDVRYFIQLYRIYREEAPNYIFHYTIKPNIYGTFAAKLLGIPCTDTMTGMGYALKKRGWLNLFALNLYKFAMNKADSVFCLNKENQQFILDHAFCNPSQLKLLPGGEGVDLEKFYYSYKEGDNVTFLMVARVLIDKGYREFVQASRKLKEKGFTNFRCALLGPIDTSYPTHISRDELERDVQSGLLEYWGITDHVQEKLELPGIVVVIPSYHEGLNRSLMEACAMGKPIITTDIPGCHETVDDGKNGFLIIPKSADDLADAMQHFLNLSEEDRKAFSEYSRRKAEQIFDVRLVLEEYKKILDKHGI